MEQRFQAGSTEVPVAPVIRFFFLNNDGDNINEGQKIMLITVY
jgi:hypothetical protein